MPRYRQHSPTVEAYQLEDTPTSQRYLINFGKGYITHAAGNSVAVMVDGQYQTAMPGDYVLKYENDRFEVWGVQDFADQWGIVL